MAMITITKTCVHCGSDQLVRNGLASNGKQRYACKSCGRRSRENPAPNGYPDERRSEILKALHERSSIRGIARTFGVSRNTVTSWMKKKTTNSQP
jgi:transposase-like protein